eukprot:scaffold308684_cov42-Prasinocladus_malaysianus.AAC.1
MEEVGRRHGIRMSESMRRPNDGRPTLGRPGKTSGVGGLFRTIREAGARANARFEFWRRRNRKAQQAATKTGGPFQTIRNFWSRGNNAVAAAPKTRKIDVVPHSPDPNHLELPPSQYTAEHP